MTVTSDKGKENLGFDGTSENLQDSIGRCSEDDMDTIDLRRSPERREDRLQLSRNEFEVHEDDPSTCSRPGKNSETEEKDRECGWCFFRPEFLQRFRTPKWVLFWLCWASAMQGMVVNGFVNVVITTIERRFGLRSSETGLVAGGYDIASFLCLVPVTYFGGRLDASKPRWIGFGVLVIAIGSFVFALPHFTVPAYRGIQQRLNLCHRNATFQEECTADSRPEYLSLNLWLFVGSQLLTGAGAAPLYTLGVTYLDENVTKKMSSVYLGIYYTLSLVGPAVGYLLGGELLKIYTDFLTNDPNEFGLTQNSNVWVGAWWVGFILSGVVCVLIAIPIIAFPPSLPGAEQIEKVSEAHGNSQFEAFRKLREIPRAFRDLIVNPTFSFLNLAGASEGFLISGFAAFMPKLIENEFSISASFAAILMGAITVPAGGGGTFLGGYLVKRLDLKCAGIIKLCILSTVVSMIFISCFFLTCPNLKFAGLNVFYADSRESRFSLSSDCNLDCGCSLLEYDPVCGIDSVAYYSPCHAGCKNEHMFKDYKVYSNCSCIKKPTRLEEVPETFRAHYSFEDSEWRGFEAQNVTCEASCGYLWYFVVLSFFVMLFTFTATMPALSATLRCVRDEQRSFALGIQWIVVRIFGTIPAPLVFGFLIDKTCVLWESDCYEQGSCLVYDNNYMSRYMFGIAVVGKACSLIFFFCSWWFYVPPTGVKVVSSKHATKFKSKPEDLRNGMNGGALNPRFEA